MKSTPLPHHLTMTRKITSTKDRNIQPPFCGCRITMQCSKRNTFQLIVISNLCRDSLSKIPQLCQMSN
ncbi:hypothetical protein QQG55_7760 [Brugia pahangi]